MTDRPEEGDVFTVERTFTKADVRAFAEAIGALPDLGGRQLDADRLLDHVTGRGRLERLTRPRDLTAAERTELAALTAARASGTPLQHLTGEADFHGLTLIAGPGALVPRPETEVLVERALALLQGRPTPVVWDVGTGSGAIAVALQVARPDAVELELSTPDAFVSPGVPVRPDPVELELATPNALIAPFLLTDEWRVGRERVRPTTIEADAESLSLSFTVEREDIEKWREELDVETPDELRASVADADVSEEAVYERQKLAEDWEYTEYRLGLIKDALAEYDRLTTGSPTTA